MIETKNIVQKPPVNTAEYRRVVRAYAQAKNGQIFENDGKECAAIVMATLFDYSQSIIRIYANDMNGDIGNIDEYYKSFSNYLFSGKYLNIILDSDKYAKEDTKGSKTFEFIKSNRHLKNVSFTKATKEFQELVKSYHANNEPIVYFSVGDNKMFRAETNNITHRAVCSMNNEVDSEILIKLFDGFFYSTKPIEIHPDIINR